MDGAPYYLSSECMVVYKALKLPLMFNPPHGYNVAHVELVFAALKSKHLNEDKLKTGKSNFDNMVFIINRRLVEIPISTRILFWYHTW